MKTNIKLTDKLYDYIMELWYAGYTPGQIAKLVSTKRRKVSYQYITALVYRY